MAKKSPLKFVCSVCSASYPVWSGRCGSCGEWNTLQEQLVDNRARVGQQLVTEYIGKGSHAEASHRITTNISQLDSVLGGGFVPGSVVLLVGEPGIGKSTLLLQIADSIGKHLPVLYVSAEESTTQLRLRASRVGIHGKHITIASTNSTNDILETIIHSSYSVVIIDSIQTVGLSEISAAMGTVGQVTNSAALLIEAAKKTNTTVLLTGHVTKEGSIAGPKVLEHAVDVVLQLEGDRYGGLKLLRSAKNRFGSTGETGIFSMGDNGLQAVENPSAALLAERQQTDGSIVFAAMEGTRALLVEIQALVNHTSYGYPKRTASGFDLNRLNVLIAVLEKRTKLNLSDKDVYVNVVGGIKLHEPAADLAVTAALASAAKGYQLGKHAVVFGEIGLSGEVRHVSYSDKRVAEAVKLGFDWAIGPPTADAPAKLLPVRTVRETLNKYLKKE